MTSLDEFARSRAILEQLDSHGRVLVASLADQLGVSTVTIRKDLEALEQRSVLRRVRGGAVPAAVSDEGSFESRLRHRRAEKEAIADAVAPLVRDGDVIALDSSSTCHYLAQQLLDRRGLVVVTNSLPTATLLSERTDANVLLPGGVVRRSARSLVGLVGDVLAGRGRIDRGFLGGHGISVEHGLLDLANEEAQAKRYLADACTEVYGLVDSAKFGGFSIHPCVPIGRLTAVYTDDGVDPAQAAAITAAGVPVHAVAMERRS
ncbi:DeoR/GlpR family DNA-binding transcription regulator [Modestobacter sp. VKM Ac-2978]|uniref:DeoR/GlpR family DNA-binding transcription regulator n=1 Tax=Modestobacter sp. VKM Ac-2978 TaxID=3004132 RepID=UPI0022AB29E9|nr:DeoR/GlpR family DNA-binding transcription regulator [Modestobacter sp. VKM Ac-2978]MCZ2847839.1 DeoR/GlpR family DNA-binding transcription regulator [Modestobacter sp. VKM Ac-2978]